MPVPKQRLSNRRGRTRASHHALPKVTTVECSQCHQAILPHRACPFCGAYRGRNVRQTAKAAPTKAKAKKETAEEVAPADTKAEAN